MIRLIFVLFSLTAVANTAVAKCTVNNDVLGAAYKITTSHLSSGVDSVRHLVLWRNGKQVAHEYKGSLMTEVWEKMTNKRLRMVNYFDKHRRGIEYQPEEIKIAHSENDWLLKRQLVTPDLMNSMKLVKTTDDTCEKIESYELKSDKLNIAMEWLSKQELAKRYEETSADKKVTWTLEKVTNNPDDVNKVFLTRSTYQMTDYTDIGDNESDPFLLKMINLGFIAHGASGFYDQDGHAIEGGHHH